MNATTNGTDLLRKAITVAHWCDLPARQKLCYERAKTAPAGHPADHVMVLRDDLATQRTADVYPESSRRHHDGSVEDTPISGR